MDMGNHALHAATFSKILKNATNSEGARIFTEAELASIVGKGNCKLQVKGQTPQEVFGTNLDRVNEALSSPYGMKVINEAYPIEVATTIKNIDDIVASIQNPAAKKFYSSDLGRAVLFDYSNVFDLQKDGKFVKEYIDGAYTGLKRNIYPSKTAEVKAPTDVYTIEDHKNYLHSTKEWCFKPGQVDGRLEKSLEVLNQYGLTPKGCVDLSEAAAKKGHLLKVSASFAELLFDYADYREEEDADDFDDIFEDMTKPAESFILAWNETEETWEACSTMNGNMFSGFEPSYGMSDEMRASLPENGGLWYDAENNHLFATLRFQHPGEEDFMSDWYHMGALKIYPYHIDNVGYLDFMGFFLHKTAPPAKILNNLYDLYLSSFAQDEVIERANDLAMLEDRYSIGSANITEDNQFDYLAGPSLVDPLKDYFSNSIEL